MNVIKINLTSILLIISISLPNAGFAAEKNNQLENALVGELISSLESKKYSEISNHISKIKSTGQTAIPALEEAIRTNDNDLASAYLVNVVSAIGGEDSTKVLIQSLGLPNKPKTSMTALSSIGNRPITFMVSTNQINYLIGTIQKGESLEAALAARVISRCDYNEKTPAVLPILDRYKKEIPKKQENLTVRGSYLSPRAYLLNQYLLSFLSLGSEAIPELELAFKNEKQTEVREWIILAEGMVGKPSVANDIKELINNSTDQYFRSIAVRAYARSAGSTAVPFLESLLQDEGQSEYDNLPNGKAIYPVRISANDELVRLQLKN
ncbi:HEAT repeat domain-containing protein [Pontiellaceae bacterium B12219]|nr:HEAT repeat domain-containing protein [Pontiellaceae bacterium B12219]